MNNFFFMNDIMINCLFLLIELFVSGMIVYSVFFSNHRRLVHVLLLLNIVLSILFVIFSGVNYSSLILMVPNVFFWLAFFITDLTPIYSKPRSHRGSILHLKNIPAQKKALEELDNYHEIILQQEKFASLGRLIGGITHNLKTPLMIISGGLDIMDESIHSIHQSNLHSRNGDPEKKHENNNHEINNNLEIINNHKNNNTHENSHEIGNEGSQNIDSVLDTVSRWIQALKPQCAYMSDTISAVREQVISSDLSNRTFTISELLSQVEILMKYQLKKHHCTLKMDIQTDRELQIHGELNNLVQVINNLILNGMEAYDNNGGVLELTVSEVGKQLRFTLKDYGKGIPKSLHDQLFKKIVTSKGIHGTGLGLYFSYSIIRDKFAGDIQFESEEGRGTTFHVIIEG